MGMGKSSAEWMVFISLLFLSIVQQGSVMEVEAGGVILASVNSSDWSKMVLQSKYRANAIISRLHGVASSNSNSTNYMHQLQLSAMGEVPVVSGNSEGTGYIVNVGFGTPPNKNMKMNFDTASDVSWLRCDYGSGSSTFKRLDCKSCYREVEGIACNGQNECILQVQYRSNGNLITAHMSQDTLWLGSQSFQNFGFGCNGFKGNPSIGLLALGRNSLSLPSQARRVFSYCLPNFLDPKQKGSLRLGDAASTVPSSSKFTALLSNPLATSWYFVGIGGISVGTTRLNIPPKLFQFDSRGGGTILDSGVLISQLVQPAYDALRAAFLKQMKLSPMKAQPQLPLPLDTCFTYSGDIAKLQIPPVTFHFQDGLNLPINQNGILAPVSEDAICLAFQPSHDFNIIGTLQQQGYTISFDQGRKRIGFAPVRTCT